MPLGLFLKFLLFSSGFYLKMKIFWWDMRFDFMFQGECFKYCFEFFSSIWAKVILYLVFVTVSVFFSKFIIILHKLVHSQKDKVSEPIFWKTKKIQKYSAALFNFLIAKKSLKTLDSSMDSLRYSIFPSSPSQNFPKSSKIVSPIT